MKNTLLALISSACLFAGAAYASAADITTDIAADSTDIANTQAETEEAVQQDDYSGIPADEYIHSEELMLAESPEICDSLLSFWYEQNLFASHENFFREFIDIDSVSTLESSVPDSVYSSRMKAILSPVSLGYNEIIKRYLIVYTQKRKDLMGRIMGLSQVYFPMIEEELMKEGLPIELRILPVIESALNPAAVSHMGATGLWQFMYATGKSYGLEITSFIDQRRDPIASTKAGVRYLKDLYSIYGDWTLAIAAYNCGPGNVNKALARAGEGARTFWDVYPYLPRETRGYVPSFIAATYAYTYHKQHGIEPVAPAVPLSTDTVRIDRLMHFDQIASTIDIPKELLRALNPQYKQDIVPAVDKKSYALTLPMSEITRYLQSEQAIQAKDTLYLAQYLQQSPKTNTKVFNITTTTYRVKSGDTLGSIAKKHGVTVKQIMSWNRLKNANVLRPGQVLEIHK